MTTHFKNVLESSGADVDVIGVQCESVKSVIYSTLKTDQIRDLSLQQLHKSFQKKYPDIVLLFDLIATIPASSSEAERGFSQMNLLKTDLRSLLTDDHLNQLMRIKLEAPDVGLYDPTPAIEKWNAGARGRPMFQRNALPSLTQVEVPSTDAVDEDQLPTEDVDELEIQIPILDEANANSFKLTESDIPEGDSDMEIEDEDCDID